MGLVNAVLVYSGARPRWVIDSASITQWGRLEDTIDVGGEITDVATIDTLGEEFLRTRSQPLVSHTVQVADTPGARAGVDYRVGDRLAEPNLRVAEIAFRQGPDGRFQATPGLLSPLELRHRQADQRWQRMLAEAGGATPVSSPPVDTGSGVRTGKLQPRLIQSWGWSEAWELDPLFSEELAESGEAWMPHEIDEPVRICEFVIRCQWMDNDDDPVADGQTRFRLVVNGAAWLAIPELGGLATDVWVDDDESNRTTEVYGGSVLLKGATVQPAIVSNGGHINGSVAVYGTDVV